MIYTGKGFFEIRTHNANIARLLPAQNELLDLLGWNSSGSIPSEPVGIRREYDDLVQKEHWNRSQIERVKSECTRAWIWVLFAWGAVDGWLLKVLSDFDFDRFDFRRG